MGTSKRHSDFSKTSATYSFSFLWPEPSSGGNFAELVSYKASLIKHLAEEFDHALSTYLYQTSLSWHKISSWSTEDALKTINEACNNYLQDLGLWDWGMAKQQPKFVWYCAS